MFLKICLIVSNDVNDFVSMSILNEMRYFTSEQ
jgi:hypothetical protein